MRELLKKPSIHIILIIAIGLLTYSNTFNVPFQFDDRTVIVDDPVIKNLSLFIEPSKVRDFKGDLEYKTFRSRYISYLSFALNYKLHGFSVTGYHIFNLTIHILNAILVYWLMVLTLRIPGVRYQVSGVREQPEFLNLKPKTLNLKPECYSPPPASVGAVHLFTYVPLFIALVFVSHPIQTQAVTYIVQRFASLATLLYLLSVVIYINFRLWVIGNRPEDKSPTYHLLPITYYLLSILSVVFAMKTKEISFTLPVVIALYEVMFFEGKFQRRMLFLIPLLFTMILIPLSRITGDLTGSVGDTTRFYSSVSRWDYLFTQFRVIVTYIRLLFLPINQNLDYDYPIYNSFLNPNVFLSFLLLLFIFGLGVYLFYRSRFTVHSSQNLNSQLETCNLKLIAFGIFWFFITLSVESSIIPLFNVIFEHRIYLPSVGFFIAIITAAFYIFQFTSARLRRGGSPLPVYCFLSIITIVFSIATFQRNNVWKDEISLWADVTQKSPRKAQPYNELGLAYMEKGNLLTAISYFEKALAIEPNLALAHSNLGNAFDELNYIDYAMVEYQKAIELNSRFETAHYNLGRIYYKKGMFGEAADEFKIAISLNPLNNDAKRNLDLISKMNEYRR